jgi:hypothetical protein
VQFETCVRLRNTLRVAHARRSREIDMPETIIMTLTDVSD